MVRPEWAASREPNSFGEPVASGSFTNSSQLQTLSFPASWAEYMRIKVLSEVNGKQFGSAAEFNILQDLEVNPLPDETVYLSDIDPASHTNGLGPYERDQSNGGPKRRDGSTLSVNDQTFAKGVGAHAPSTIVYELDGRWDRLEGHVGVDDEVEDDGSIMFRVYGDGKLLFESPRMSAENVKQLMSLDIEGITELKLKVLDLKDGSKGDHGDWLDVKLIRKGSE